jgi:hypothetical protein
MCGFSPQLLRGRAVVAGVGSLCAVAVRHNKVVGLGVVLCVLVWAGTFGVAGARADSLGSYDFTDVACPSASQCTAVYSELAPQGTHSDGGEVTFNPTAPATASASTIDTSGALLSVACPSGSQCTAVDGVGGEVTFNPAAPGTPSRIAIDGSGDLVSVACPSVSECVTVDSVGQEVTFEPTAPATASASTIDTSGALRRGGVPLCVAVHRD